MMVKFLHAEADDVENVAEQLQKQADELASRHERVEVGTPALQYDQTRRMMCAIVAVEFR